MNDQPSSADQLDPDRQPTVTSYSASGTKGPARRERRHLPSAIGGYRILALLGEGGMGTVYKAEQQNPHRVVALKVIKLGVASEQLLRRFEQEAEALGRLQHPGIAQIYEAGTADTGLGLQPYFAMEFIHGLPLMKYATERHLNVRARLELMARLCDAVNHAHQRGIIHRDLKPGNILVDEAGQPKILDFGVARVTDSDAQVTRQTDLGQLVGTLAYMSPEQVLGNPLELDIRSDVYSLGVILYELLAGKRPYQIDRKTLHLAMHTIREEDPTRLSTINRIYRGDIETIVAKALEKDKERRYASAADLAADIQRYLTDEPIVARPPSTGYQLQKFARRHRTLVAGVGAVFAVLIVGIVGMTWETVRARRAEQTALTAERTATAVNDFLQNDLLAQAGASAQAGRNTDPDPDLKVRTALDRAAARIAGKFSEQPLVEASIRQTIGRTYQDLGLLPEAQKQVEFALELQRKVLGEAHPDTLRTSDQLGVLYYHAGQYTKAESLLSKVLAAQRRVLGNENSDTLGTMDFLGYTYRDEGKYAQAEPLLKQALEGQRRTLGDAHPDTIAAMNELGLLYEKEEEYGPAVALLSKALELQRAQGELHPDTLSLMNNLGTLYYSYNQYADAERLFAKLLDARLRVLGETHPDTLVAMNNLAASYRLQGKFAEAEALNVHALELSRRVKGALHPDTLVISINVAAVYRSEGKYKEAEALLMEVLELPPRLLGRENPIAVGANYNLAELYRLQGDYQRAEPLFAEVVEFRRRVPGLRHRSTAAACASLGRTRLEQAKFAAAEQPLRDAVSGYEGKPDTWALYIAQSMLGESLAGQKRYSEAEPLLLDGFEGARQRQATIPADNRSQLGQAAEWIDQLYQHWGKPDQAAAWKAKLASNKAGAAAVPRK